MTMEMVFQEISLYFVIEASNIDSAAYHEQQEYILNKSSAGSQEQCLLAIIYQTISLEEVKSQKFSIFQINFWNMPYKTT